MVMFSKFAKTRHAKKNKYDIIFFESFFEKKKTSAANILKNPSCSLTMIFCFVPPF